MAEVTQVQMDSTGPNDPAQGQVLRFQERPEWVPEKFYKDGEVNVLDLAKSYAELEKQRGSSQPQAQPQTKQQPEQKSEAPKMEPVQIPGVAPEAATKYTEEIQKGGKLSDGSYEELAKAGYPKAVVDAYIKGLTADASVEAAVQQDRTNVKESRKIIDSIGGQEKYEEMVGWAADNLSPEEQKVYNEAVQSGDMVKAKIAIQGLHARFKEVNGEDMNLLGGEPGGNPSGEKPYESTYELTLDMNNPRYAQDEGFRAKVARRLKISSIM